MVVLSNAVVLCGKGEGFVKYSKQGSNLRLDIKMRMGDVYVGSYYLAALDKDMNITHMDIGKSGKIEKTIEHKNIFSNLNGLVFAVVHVDVNYYNLFLIGGNKGDVIYENIIKTYFQKSPLYLGKTQIAATIFEPSIKPIERSDTDTRIDIIAKNIQPQNEKQQEDPAFGARDKVSKIEAIFDKSARENFYESVEGQLSDIFFKYEKEENLQRLIEGSKWAKIQYGKDNEYYTVGVIYENGKPTYICYGVPSSSSNVAPKELRGYCEFLPIYRNSQKGYWMMYQNADNGELISLKER